MSNPGELIICKLLEWSKIVLPLKYWNVLWTVFEGLNWLLIHHVDVDLVVDIREVFRLAKTKARNINSLENGKKI